MVPSFTNCAFFLWSSICAQNLLAQRCLGAICPLCPLIVATGDLHSNILRLNSISHEFELLPSDEIYKSGTSNPYYGLDVYTQCSE